MLAIHVVSLPSDELAGHRLVETVDALGHAAIMASTADVSIDMLSIEVLMGTTGRNGIHSGANTHG